MHQPARAGGRGCHPKGEAVGDRITRSHWEPQGEPSGLPSCPSGPHLQEARRLIRAGVRQSWGPGVSPQGAPGPGRIGGCTPIQPSTSASPDPAGSCGTFTPSLAEPGHPPPRWPRGLGPPGDDRAHLGTWLWVLLSLGTPRRGSLRSPWLGRCGDPGGESWECPWEAAQVPRPLLCLGQARARSSAAPPARDQGSSPGFSALWLCDPLRASVS